MTKPIKKLLLYSAYFLFVIVRSLHKIIPLRLSLRLGAALGFLGSYLATREVEIAKAQIDFVRKIQARSGVPLQTDKNSESLARATFSHIGRTCAEVLLIPRLLKREEGRAARKEDFQYISSEGLEEVFQGLSEGKGAVALGAHIGCIELLAAYHVALGVPLSVVARSANFPPLNSLLVNIRKSYGVETLWRDDAGTVKRLLKSLKDGNFVAALMDQDTALESIYSPFFEVEAATPSSLIHLVLRHRLPLFTSFIVRTSELHHHVINEQIHYDPEEPNADQKIAQIFHQRLEALIVNYPEQWVWWHRRWRRRPGIDYAEQPELLPSTSEYVSWLKTLPKLEQRSETRA